MKRKILVLTGGGDCPGLNAVIRGIVKRASQEKDFEIIGSIEAFNGIYQDPPNVIKLKKSNTAGIHIKGGTILKTTNKGHPFEYPVQNEDGSITITDRSKYLIDKLKSMGVEAVINIGGDGSQKISKGLFDQGLPIVYLRHLL